ncbi:hypothetical protein HETIRDRAFT_406548, partial [Heterobasidion irregulare TC 32-1]
MAGMELQPMKRFSWWEQQSSQSQIMVTGLAISNANGQPGSGNFGRRGTMSREQSRKPNVPSQKYRRRKDSIEPD